MKKKLLNLFALTFIAAYLPFSLSAMRRKKTTKVKKGSAGVLPFFKDSKENIFFLLGEDRWDEGKWTGKGRERHPKRIR